MNNFDSLFGCGEWHIFTFTLDDHEKIDKDQYITHPCRVISHFMLREFNLKPVSYKSGISNGIELEYKYYKEGDWNLIHRSIENFWNYQNDLIKIYRISTITHPVGPSSNPSNMVIHIQFKTDDIEALKELHKIRVIEVKQKTPEFLVVETIY